MPTDDPSDIHRPLKLVGWTQYQRQSSELNAILQNKH
jgi:hypothetical protein